MRNGVTITREEDHWIKILYVNPSSPNNGQKVYVEGEDLVRGALLALGEDPDRPGLQETPARVVKAWAELFAGYRQNPKDVLKVFTDCGQVDEMVIMRDIPFTSFCEHHMLPFSGHAHVAYLPENGRVVGLSKLARLVEIYARRLQVQERMTVQIADALFDRKYPLAPKGAAVVVRAEHGCMSCRGVRKHGTTTITSALRGAFKDDAATRAEFLSLTGVR